MLVSGVEKVNQFTYIHSFLDCFPIEASTEYWEESPVLYSGSLVLTNFIYSSVYMGLPQCLKGKESICNAGATRDTDLIPGLGRPPGGRHGNPSSILPWKIPRTEDPGGLQSIGSHRAGHDWSDSACTHTCSVYVSTSVSQFSFPSLSW